MADSAVVLDNVLCFLLARFGKTSIKQLKVAVLDFYTPEDICCAKENVLHAVELWISDIKLPHIPLRREGESRTAKTLDDIITVLTCLDENLKLKCLPKYVSDSPDAMPSIRIYDGDLYSLMAAFDKLKERMCSAETALAAILQAVNTTKDMLITRSVHSESATMTGKQIAPDYCPSDVYNTGLSSIARAQVDRNETATFGISNRQSAEARSWAAEAAVSVPIDMGNKFSLLQQIDDCGNVTGSDSQNDDAFVVHRSRRSVKRQRQLSRLEQQERQDKADQQLRQQSYAGAAGTAGTAQQQRDAQQRNVADTVQQRRGRVMMTGKSKQVRGDKFLAAKSIVKKAVFCVDNLNISVTVEDLRQFVSGLSVDVLSCFNVKPRKMRNESEPIKNRKAFRLCIAAKDKHLLLDDSKWPDSVVISEWFHVNPTVSKERSAVKEPAATEIAAGTVGEADDTVIYSADADTDVLEHMDLTTTGDNGE